MARPHDHLPEAAGATWFPTDSVSPLATLARGYSITQNEHGQVITRALQVKPGDILETRLAEGRVRSGWKNRKIHPTRPESPTTKPACQCKHITQHRAQTANRKLRFQHTDGMQYATHQRVIPTMNDHAGCSNHAANQSNGNKGKICSRAFI